MRILLAEDDRLLGDGMQAGLRALGFQVDWVRDGFAAERELRAQDYSAVVLDLTLEDGSEISVKGDEEIEYDGEKHTAANLFDALKEGYYGKF